MIDVFIFIIIFIFNWALIRIFITLSPRIGLQDLPNNRSSHDYHVVRGGGLVFAISWFMHAFLFGDVFTWYNAGLLLLFIIGFWDDIKQIRPAYRLLWQFIAVFLFLYDSNGLHLENFGYLVLLMFVLTYLINVFNFMDGINGMLGFYGLTVLVSLAMFGYIQSFSISSPMAWLLGSLLAFLFFNARKRAMVFSGDVGSLTLAFVVLYFVFNFNQPAFDLTERLSQIIFSICCVSVFLMDSLTTIFHRLMLRENIFKSHRFHLYQLITPRFIKSQLLTSFLYASFQLMIIFFAYHEATTLFKRMFLLIFMALFFFLLRYLSLKNKARFQES